MFFWLHIRLCFWDNCEIFPYKEDFRKIFGSIFTSCRMTDQFYPIPSENFSCLLDFLIIL